MCAWREALPAADRYSANAAFGCTSAGAVDAPACSVLSARTNRTGSMCLPACIAVLSEHGPSRYQGAAVRAPSLGTECVLLMPPGIPSMDPAGSMPGLSLVQFTLKNFSTHTESCSLQAQYSSLRKCRTNNALFTEKDPLWRLTIAYPADYITRCQENIITPAPPDAKTDC